MGVPWDMLLGDADRRLRGSDIRDLLAVTARPDIISFAGGLPAPDLFPIDDLRAAFDAALREGGGSAVQYGPTEGYAPLRAYLAARLARRGIGAPPEDILITTGSQQGLDLVGKVLLSPRATVLVEEPSYVGALQAFAAYGPRVVSAPMDDEGLRVDRVDTSLAPRGRDPRGHDNPAILYTIPTFQNPSGLTMSRRRRAALIKLCADRGLPVIEDDPYGELRYEGADLPPLRALPGGADTVYLGTFSKILAPGLRLGWVVAPRPLLARLVRAKQGADLHTDTLAQRAVLQYCLHADLDGHIARLRRVYRERRDAMLAALARYFPPEARWTRPEGGLFLWVTLPEGVDTRALLASALERGVAFVPGSAFHAARDGGQGERSLRLNFSHADPERIDDGLRRLGAVVAASLARPALV